MKINKTSTLRLIGAVIIFLFLSQPVLASLDNSGYNGIVWGSQMTISGNYLYVVSDYSGLQVVDISDPLNPADVASYNDYNVYETSTGEGGEEEIEEDRDDEFDANDIIISGSTAYMVDSYNGLLIMDVSDPVNATLLGRYDFASDLSVGSQALEVEGSYAYIVNDQALGVFDVSAPSTPTVLGGLNLGCSTYGTALSGDYLYIACGRDGLKIINVSAPSTPTLTATYDTDNAWNVAVSGNYVYVADQSAGLLIVDVSTPATPQLAGSYVTDSLDTHYITNVVISGAYAYLADQNLGLQVVDISTPSTPTLVTASEDLSGYYSAIAVSGNNVYLARYSTSSGLYVFEVEAKAATTSGTGSSSGSGSGSGSEDDETDDGSGSGSSAVASEGIFGCSLRRSD